MLENTEIESVIGHTIIILATTPIKFYKELPAQLNAHKAKYKK